MEVKPGYKQTEVGVIPEEWDAVQLGRMIKLQGGYAFQSSDFSDIGVPVIRISDIQEGVVRVDGATCHPPIRLPDDFVVHQGDVLVAMSGATTGKVGLFHHSKPAYQNQRVGKFVVRDKSRTSRSFIEQLVRSSVFVSRLGVFLEQGAQPNISGNQIESLVFATPKEFSEQHAIAEVLGDVDALLGSLEKLIAKKRDLKQAAMQQLLTGKKRLPGFSGEWEVKKLGDVAALNRLNVVPANFPNQMFTHFSLPAFDDGKLPVIEPGAGIGSNKFRVLQGAVLVSKLNPRIPRVWAPDTIPPESIASTEFLVLTPSEGMSRQFLFVLCSSALFCEQMELAATGTTGSHQRISPSVALILKVSVPVEVEEQTAIAEVLSDMDAELAALEQRLTKTRDLKQGMMQELLTGRTRLV